MYNGNYQVASLVYIYNVYVCSKTIFSPVMCTCNVNITCFPAFVETSNVISSALLIHLFGAQEFVHFV